MDATSSTEITLAALIKNPLKTVDNIISVYWKLTGDDLYASEFPEVASKLEEQSDFTVTLPNNQICSVKCVESIGGSEGQGESVLRVYAVSLEGVITYIKFTGWYNSYSGIEWNDDCTLVKPVEVTVVKYVEL